MATREEEQTVIALKLLSARESTKKKVRARSFAALGLDVGSNPITRPGAPATVAEHAMQQAVVQAMQDLGVSNELKNAAYIEAHHLARERGDKQGQLAPEYIQMLQNSAAGIFDPDDDLLDPVRDASARWVHSIQSELLALVEERGRPLARLRQDNIDTSAEEVGKSGEDGFLFDTEDLLEAIAEIRSPNRSDFLRIEDEWCLVRLSLQTATLSELQAMYSELCPDQSPDSCRRDGAGSEAERRLLGQRVLGVGFAPFARQYAKRGVPACLRPKLWRIILGLPPETTEEEQQTLRQLSAEVDRLDLITDELYQLDVQAIADDDKFFVFEDRLSEVMMAFSRDSWILENSRVRVHATLRGHACPGQPSGVAIPPSGVQPFRGLVSYAAPLCFLYVNTAELFHVLREMFASYWCRLNALQSTPDGLLSLLKMFEDLVGRHAPAAVQALLMLDLQPLKIAAAWIQFSFVGVLEVQELLLLWDLILAYDTLALLPVLAAAVFVFRAEAIKSASNVAEVEEMFADGSKLQVIPLLQAFMFPAAC
jgi:hypothetical protein